MLIRGGLMMSLVALLVAGATSGLAQTSGAASSASPGLVASLVPEFVTMDQKLGASDQVFVGTGRRI